MFLDDDDDHIFFSAVRWEIFSFVIGMVWILDEQGLDDLMAIVYVGLTCPFSK